MVKLNEPIESAYFNWLAAKVKKRSEVTTPALTHWNLFRELQNTEFVWLVPLDDNRAADGKELRRDFLRAFQIQAPSDWMDIPCSVFEMMIAFSVRAAFSSERSSKEWFWEFLYNLGLKKFNDAEFNLNKVTDILYVFIWRTYDYHGNGGMFPIKNPVQDQRKVEIWYQFSEYLVDRDLI